MKASLAFVTLSSILTIMPFRVNELYVSNVTSLSWTDEQSDYTFILPTAENVWTHRRKIETWTNEEELNMFS